MDWGHKESFWEEVSLGLGLKDGNNLIYEKKEGGTKVGTLIEQMYIKEDQREMCLADRMTMCGWMIGNEATSEDWDFG